MNILKVIYHELKYKWYMMHYYLFTHINKLPEIVSIEETIEKLIIHKKSIARFGDGEMRWILNISQDSFQEQNKDLQKDLIRVLTIPNDYCLIGLPPGMTSLRENTKYAKRFWSEHFVKEGEKILKYLNPEKKYYNSDISRFYIGYADIKKAESRFNFLKRVWNNRNILIVEGEKTKLGVGNDLFSNVKSIRRILAPHINAYSKYEEILKVIQKEYQKEDLVLLALGPTATVLAYDLSLKEIQAIDIGHIDVEYEWFKMKTRQKVAIKGKYVNEAGISGKVVEEINDPVYLSQVVQRIKLER